MAKHSDRVKVSTCGLSFTGDVRLAAQVYESLRCLPPDQRSPIVEQFLWALRDDLLRIKKEMKA